MTALSHRGASRTSKDLRGWQPFNQSADADILGELGILKSRAQDMARNHGLVSGYDQTLKDNVLGTGLRFRSKPDYKALGKSKEWADEFAAQVNSKFTEFSESKDFSLNRKQNFREMSNIVLSNVGMEGNALAIPYYKKRAGSNWGTCFQLIDCERLSNPNMAMDTDKLRGGIEHNSDGSVAFYHIRNGHPMDIGFGVNAAKWRKIPAFTKWGRPRVLHIFDAKRPAQSKGQPALSALLEPFKMVDHYHLTELKTSIASSQISAFVESSLDSEAIAHLMGMYEGGENSYDYVGQRNEWQGKLEGGKIIHVPVGDRIVPFSPNRNPSAFGLFIESLYRQIAVGLNVPYEVFMKDFSKTNYSGARVILLEVWRFFMGRRQFIIDNWANQVLPLFFEEAVNTGKLDAPDFYQNRYAYMRGKWIGAGKGFVDPVKEEQGARLRMENRTSTLEDECAMQGKDWEEVIEQAAIEDARLKEYGLTRGDLAAFMTPQPAEPEPEMRAA